ncbi:hypothetical protein T12_13643 [Trichinella patagoniensis]|uniref:Uncharacterized protein n=1 Tax=Trichinella patagoniensis TaxID=990121 RepID=A0A0V0Z5U8_9BILA|nr:hypothetical protein T12_13643 [Trichinella patagoniensis]
MSDGYQMISIHLRSSVQANVLLSCFYISKTFWKGRSNTKGELKWFLDIADYQNLSAGDKMQTLPSAV